jgi:hypothetical protein
MREIEMENVCDFEWKIGRGEVDERIVGSLIIKF